jgi:hypothetical protein
MKGKDHIRMEVIDVLEPVQRVEDRADQDEKHGLATARNMQGIQHCLQ